MCKIGDIVYIHDNAYGICKCQIMRKQGNYYTVKLLDHKCAYRVPEHRLMTEVELIHSGISLNPGYAPPQLH